MSLSTIAKAGDLLDLFDGSRSELGVSEAAGRLGLPKSSAHDLLAALAETGLLERTERGRYRLGWRVLALSRAMLETSELRRSARPTVRGLSRHLGRTVHLATLQGAELAYLDKVEGATSPPIEVSGVGRRPPARGTALGKVLLAHRPDPDASLDEELREVRERGFARASEELVPGICCFASPVRGPSGTVVAALSVSVGAAEAPRREREYLRLVGAGAARISRQLCRGARSATG
ncbi:MAG: IclR family transcriptional regulator [Solirubrobacterales bacterium]